MPPHPAPAPPSLQFTMVHRFTYNWHLGLQLHMSKKLVSLLDLCVSSLRRGHANLLCIVPILTDDPRRESTLNFRLKCSTIHAKNRILGNAHAPLEAVEREVQSRAGCTKATYRPCFSNKKCGIKSIASNIVFCPPPCSCSSLPPIFNGTPFYL